MSEITISEARERLSSVVDSALTEPVYLTRRGQPIAAVVNAELLEQLLQEAEELADVRAVDEAWEEAELLGEIPIPWDEAKRDLGL